jgi:hypothetical protein
MWVLTLKYVLFVCIGAAVYATAAPSLERAFDEWYTPFWALAVCACGLVAFIGSLVSERVEKWGASGLFVLMGVYAFAPIMLVIGGDIDRLAYSIIAITLSLLPYARAVQLWNKEINARVDH